MNKGEGTDGGNMSASHTELANRLRLILDDKEKVRELSVQDEQDILEAAAFIERHASDAGEAEQAQDERPCAWLRYKDYNGKRPTSIHLCDPDNEGAFPVYTHPAPTAPDGGEWDGKIPEGAHVEIITPPIPESEVIRFLRATIDEQAREIVRLRQAAAALADKPSSKLIRSKEEWK